VESHLAPAGDTVSYDVLDMSQAYSLLQLGCTTRVLKFLQHHEWG
jgi:hypothetical protein